MATALETARLMLRCRAALLAVALGAVVTGAARGQDATAEPPAPPISKDCEALGIPATGATQLPKLTQALKERKIIRILSIGTSSSSGRDPVRGNYNDIIEKLLESTIRGLDVQIIDRGVSGELAAAVAERLKVEVALTDPDLVLWQMGSNDAMARIPVNDFKATITEMVRWLKAHNVDVILIGMQYARQMATDPHYQALRAAVRDVAEAEGVRRIGRYEITELLDKARSVQGQPAPDALSITEAGYTCMAELVARSISAGVFAKK